MNKYVRLIRGYIVQRKIRSMLTIIGVFIGITAVFALISIGQGAQNFIDDQFKAAGSNRITVMAGGGGTISAPGSSLISAKLYEKDVQTVARSRGVDFAQGYILQGVTLNFNDEKKSGFALGIPTDSMSINEMRQANILNVVTGRYFKSGDKYSAIIGSGVSTDFFSKDVVLGSKLLIDGQEFSVVGITEKTGNPLQDQRVVIPIQTAKDMFGTGDEVSMIVAIAQEGFSTDQVVQNIEKDLRKERNVKKGEEDFSVTTAKQMADTFSSILGVITAFIIGIAAISLIVGSVGIMNSMYTSVTERTRDIGVMKAIGARNSDIALVFVMESGILGLAGGVAGVIFGAIIGKVTEIVAVASGVGIFRSYISPELVIGSLLFSFAIGALSGLLPAMEASRLSPVEAFRYKR